MTDDFKRFAAHFREHVAPAMAGSTYVISIAPGLGDEDIKSAVEIGYCILLDKPLVVFKPAGRMVSPRLLRIADKVIEFDMDDKAAWNRASEELRLYMEQ